MSNYHEARLTALHEGMLKLRRDLSDLANQVKQVKEAQTKDIPAKVSACLVKLLSATYKKELARDQFDLDVQGLIDEYAGTPQPKLEEPTIEALDSKIRVMDTRMQFIASFANEHALIKTNVNRSRARAKRRNRGRPWAKVNKGKVTVLGHDDEHQW